MNQKMPSKPMKTKAEQLQEEADYRHAERLGILCGSEEPTPAQRKIADDERAEFLRKHQNTKTA